MTRRRRLPARARRSRVLRGRRRLLRAGIATLGAIGFAAVAGCAAGPEQPVSLPPAASRLHVVPFESPPLIVPSNGGGLFVLAIGRPAFGLFSLLQMAAAMPDAVRRSAEATRALDAELRGATGWEPTRVIADLVRERLQPGAAAVTVDAALRPVPGVGAVEVHMLSNTWIRAVRAWHDDDTPTQGYAALAAGGAPALVVEVAIRHYELTAGQLFLGVDLRLVDAGSGRVVGRAFEHSLGSLEPVQDSFADGARRYKELFAAQARQLSERCLVRLGLRP